LQAITNMFAMYNPDVIAIHTTCLSETIGDDIVQIIAKAREEGKVPAGKHVIHANTPSYVGSHVTGFSSMVKGMVHYFSEATGRKRNQLNVIPGWVEPSDMRELRRISRAMGINTNVFPDTSDVLDAPQTGRHEFYPRGGATVQEIRQSGDCRSTLALGPTASEAAALALEEKCGVRSEVLELPIGLLATDRFINALRHRAGVRVPSQITDERGRLVDMVADMHQYFYRKRVALFGDPDQLVALAEFLVTLDMRPVYIVTGTPGKRFETRVRELIGDSVPEVQVRQGAQADMFLLHQMIKKEGVDLLIGNTMASTSPATRTFRLCVSDFPLSTASGTPISRQWGTWAACAWPKRSSTFLWTVRIETPPKNRSN
jgi:nitrogenase molybdenum-iron protein beta chain